MMRLLSRALEQNLGFLRIIQHLLISSSCVTGNLGIKLLRQLGKKGLDSLGIRGEILLAGGVSGLRSA
jgi:hypothetical protein